MSDKSKETLLWEQLLNEFREWNTRWNLADSGKLIGGAISSGKFIKQLKSKYYLDLMKHSEETSLPKHMQTLNSKTDGVIFPNMNFGTVCSKDGTEAEFHVFTRVRFKKDGIWYLAEVSIDNKLICDRDILGASYAVNAAVKLCLEIITKKEITEYTFLDKNQEN